MIQAIAALSGAALTIFACYCLGSAITAWAGAKLRRAEKFPLAFLVGAAVLHLGTFAIFALKIAYRPVLVGALLLASFVGVRTGHWRLPPADSPGWPRALPYRVLKIVYLAAAFAFANLYLSNAWAPEISPDGATYHLGLIARYLRVHGFEQVATNFYSSLSQGAEMLFAPAFAIGQHSAAALVHLGFLAALALAVYAYGVRIRRPVVGASAALLTFASPVVGIDASSAYVDVAAAAVAFGVFSWLQIWEEEPSNRTLAIVGLLGGYAYAVKYTVAVILLFAVGFVVWKARSLRPILVVVAAAVVMAAPWMIKNWIYVDNPIAPFANNVFRNQYIHPDFERAWRDYLRRYGMTNLWELPLEVTVRGKATAGMVGPVFLAAPLAFFALRQRHGRRLLAAGGLLFATYFANVGARFLIPSLPFLSLSMALALEPLIPVLGLLVLTHAYASWPSVLFKYATPSWALLKMQYGPALRIVPAEDFLNRHVEYRYARLIEKYVPEGGRVLTPNGIPEAYTSREILVAFQSARNRQLMDPIYFSVGAESRIHDFTFAEHALRGVRLVQTAHIPNVEEQWSINEIRLYHRQKQIAGERNWRIDAFPWPWGAHQAFDASYVSRWRTWETAAPGMYISVLFPHPQTLDEVQVERVPDEWDVKMEVQVLDETGHWNKIPTQVSEKIVKVADNLRREATWNMHKEGVDYLFMRDDDYGAAEFREHPEQWGVTLVARESGASLYKVIP